MPCKISGFGDNAGQPVTYGQQIKKQGVCRSRAREFYDSITPSAHPPIAKWTDNSNAEELKYWHEIITGKATSTSLCSRALRINFLLKTSAEILPVRDLGKCKGQFLYLTRRFLMFFDGKLKRIRVAFSALPLLLPSAAGTVSFWFLLSQRHCYLLPAALRISYGRNLISHDELFSDISKIWEIADKLAWRWRARWSVGQRVTLPTCLLVKKAQ